ncbi:hypothetical protein SBY92_001926 [Candida maltosa Xu316]
MKVYNHPILVNPTRWLDLPVKHASNLYQSGYYQSLQQNPFADALTKIESNSPRTTIPHGIGIPLTVTTDTKNAVLTPKVDLDDVIKSEPWRLIINSEKYIRSQIADAKGLQKFAPMRFFQQNNPGKLKIGIKDNVLEYIETSYLEKIQELLKVVSDETSKKNGIQLVTDMEEPMRVDAHITYVRNVFLKDKDLFIDYVKHPKLSKLIIMYTNFKNL